MTKQSDREAFVGVIVSEGGSVAMARALMRASATLHRLAELECSSEWAYNDRIPCPASREWYGVKGLPCLCEDYDGDKARHTTVPRYAVEQELARRKVVRALEGTSIEASFSGDPRGAVIRLHVPSGKDEGWGGVAVP